MREKGESQEFKSRKRISVSQAVIPEQKIFDIFAK